MDILIRSNHNDLIYLMSGIACIKYSTVTVRTSSTTQVWSKVHTQEQHTSAVIILHMQEILSTIKFPGWCVIDAKQDKVTGKLKRVCIDIIISVHGFRDFDCEEGPPVSSIEYLTL